MHNVTIMDSVDGPEREQMQGVYNVYLCINDNGYVHIAFDSMRAAAFWCSKHTDYHVIIREVHFCQPSE